MDVVLNLYDLSQGMARSLSLSFLGKQIDGIWHTGIVVFGQEYYFGGGICCDPAGATPYGVPVQSIPLGKTEKTHQQFISFLESVRHRFTPQTYDLIANNCNNFTSECTQFLIPGHNIPQFILDLPGEVLSTPLGAMLRPAIDNMQRTIAQSGGNSAFEGGGGGGGAGATPFTAANASAAAAAVAALAAASSTTTPLRRACKQPVVLGKGEVSLICKKLTEFAPGSGKDDSISELVAVASSLGPEKAFPALDLIRLRCATHESDCTEIADLLEQILRDYVSIPNAPRPSKMMALRIICNCLSYESASCLVLTCPGVTEQLGEAIAGGLAAGQHHAVQVAAAAVACNIGCACERGLPVGEDVAVRVAFAASEWLISHAQEAGSSTTITTSEAASTIATDSADLVLHCLVAIGGIVNSHETAMEVCKSLELKSALSTPAITKDARNRELARELAEILS